MKATKLMMALLLGLLLAACSTKQTPIDDLRDLSEELTQHGAAYTQEDWQSAAKTYEDIEKDLARYDYTDAELQEIGKLKAKCGIAFAHAALGNVGEYLHDFGMEMKGAVEEVSGAMGDLNNALEEIDDETREGLEDAADELVDALGGASEE